MIRLCVKSQSPTENELGMTLPLVIVNPESAGGSTRKSWPKIASDLRSHFGPFTNVFTDKRGAATTLANDAARRGVKLIIACGGDGTISEVANGILCAKGRTWNSTEGTGATSDQLWRYTNPREAAVLRPVDTANDVGRFRTSCEGVDQLVTF